MIFDLSSTVLGPIRKPLAGFLQFLLHNYKVSLTDLNVLKIMTLCAEEPEICLGLCYQVLGIKQRNTLDVLMYAEAYIIKQLRAWISAQDLTQRTRLITELLCRCLYRLYEVMGQLPGECTAFLDVLLDYQQPELSSQIFSLGKSVCKQANSVPEKFIDWATRQLTTVDKGLHDRIEAWLDENIQSEHIAITEQLATALIETTYSNDLMQTLLNFDIRLEQLVEQRQREIESQLQ